MLVKEIELNLTVPMEGLKVSTPISYDEYDFLNQLNKPQVTANEGMSDEDKPYYVYNSYWASEASEEGIKTPFTGTLSSSNEYFCVADIDFNVDKYPADKYTLKVNGQPTNIEYYENYVFSTKLVFKVRPLKDDNEYKKGDLDRNGVIDANDASIALEIFKAENATAQDILIGDMDDNKLIDANDASLILELYKTNN